MVTARLVVLLSASTLVLPLTGMVHADAPDSQVARAPITLNWSHALPDDPYRSAVALGPGRGSVSVTSLLRPAGRSSQLVVRRWAENGSRMWTRRWDGGRGVGWVHGEQVEVSPATGGIVIAGNATCRFGASESGPMFLRRYDASGRVAWTRWDGRCPMRNDPSPSISPSGVTGLDVSGRTIVVSLNYGDFCCEDRTRDGVVRAYSSPGRLRWVRDIEFPQFDRTNDVVEDVALSGRRVFAVGRVETKRPLAPNLDVESWVVSLGRAHGGVRWRQVASDRGKPDYDANLSIGAGRRTLFVGGVRNATLASDDPGTAVLERLSPAGERIWRRRLPAGARINTVVALRDGDVIGAADVGYAYGVDLLLQRLQPGGDEVWTYLWDRGDRSVFIADFDAREHRGFGGGRTETEPGVNAAARLWSWTW